MKRHAAPFLFLVFFSLFSAVAHATPSPMDMLQPTSDKMLSELKVHQSTLKSDPNRVFNIVDKVLLPHFDMDYMARSVIGRAAWMSATAQEKKDFTPQFTELLTRTYAAALASYSDQTVKFYPIRGGYEGQTQVTVQSEVVQPSAPAVPVSYILLLEGNQWKVVDFSVDNVSVVNNFRAQFSGDLDQGGLANLTQKLKEHNQKLSRADALKGNTNNE
ncbi:MAG TPA: ABC transporter substrate-binding protein [Gammaproteobacteria bacterium]|nr:ABC transporter substrate-binding protein [Gammaproteobacteria bacterium]